MAKKQLQNAVDDNIQITSDFNAKQRVIDDLKQQLQHEVIVFCHFIYFVYSTPDQLLI